MKNDIIRLVLAILLVVGVYFGIYIIQVKSHEKASESLLNASQSAIDKYQSQLKKEEDALKKYQSQYNK